MNTRIRRSIALAAIVTLSCHGTASAVPVVTFTLDQSVSGQFKVLAGASLGDNFGLVSYSIPLTGALTSLDHLSPNTAFANGPGAPGPAGWTSLRTADGDPLIHATQDTITPTGNIIRGFGQTAGSFAALGITPVAPAEQPIWGAPLLIAQGTCSGPCQLDFNRLSIDLDAGVFQSATTVESTNPNLELVVINVPEPVSLLLMAFSATCCIIAGPRAAKVRSSKAESGCRL